MRLHRLFVSPVTSVFAGVMTWATLASGQPIAPAVLKNLHDSKWTVRAEAVAQLTADSLALQTPATRKALIEQLDWENHLLRDPRRFKFASVAENEAWAEYYSALLGKVDALVDPGDEHSVTILVQSAYNPDSPFAIRLASYGQTVVPALLKINSDPDPDRRSDSYEVLGYVLRHHRLGTSRYPPSKQSVSEIESRLRAGLRDAEPVVRMEAIQGLRAAGDTASLPVLEELSKSDPYVLPDTTNYFIRKQASKAIDAIKANPLGK
jgi:HEAT repeat protein